MNRRQIILISVLSSFFTLVMVISSTLFFSGAMAASVPESRSLKTESATVKADLQAQPYVDDSAFWSVSALAFSPINSNAQYIKDTTNQLLKLNYQNRTVAFNGNIFIAPLTVPDGTVLTGMTVFGEDFDTRGAIRMRLKRCDLNQARCITLAETSSTETFSAGLFETPQALVSPRETINNHMFTYFLELEITTVTSNSGLRSVRLAALEDGGVTLPNPGEAQTWSLAGSSTRFPLPNLSRRRARICTDDLSHLDNPTHYPSIEVDGQIISLSSDECVTVEGYDIAITRKMNTGPSSGTYLFIP